MKDLFLAVFGIFLMVACPAALVTHLIRCFSEEQWGLLIAGSIAFPVAIIHGFLIRIGVV